MFHSIPSAVWMPSLEFEGVGMPGVRCFLRRNGEGGMRVLANLYSTLLYFDSLFPWWRQP